MARFSVQVENLSKQQDSLYSLQRQIEGISESVDEIKRSVAAFPVGGELVSSVGRTANQIRVNAQSMGVLANAVGSAVNLYSGAESGITQRHTDHSDIKLVSSVPKQTNPIMDNILIRGGVSTIQNMVENYVGEKGAEVIAESIMQRVMSAFPQLFVDRGLVYSLISGGTMVMAETPSWLVSMIRSGSKILVPSIGAAFDYSLQRMRGVDSKDALIKAGAHGVIGMGAQAFGTFAGAKIGAAIGTAIPVPVVGTVVGAVVGAAGSVAFDFVYDHREEIGKAIVDTATNVTQWVSDTPVGQWIGERAADVGNAFESAGRWIGETGAKIGNAFSNLGSAFSFSW
jgi:hypothetical protein